MGARSWIAKIDEEDDRSETKQKLLSAIVTERSADKTLEMRARDAWSGPGRAET